MRTARALGLAGLLAAPLAQDGPRANGESYALFRGLHEARRIHLSVPRGPCDKAAERLADRVNGALELVHAPEPRAPTDVRMLVGAPTDREILPCATACGIEPVVGGFRALGREYTGAADVLTAVIEDPEHAGRPLCFVLANDLELVAAYLDGIPRLSRPYLWIHSGGEPALECPLEPGGRPRTEEVRDYAARRERYFDGGHVNVTDDGSLTVHARRALVMARWRPYALALGLVQRRVVRWFGAPASPACEVFVYDHVEDFEACLGTSALALANRFRPRLHVLVAYGMPDDGGAALARVLARTMAGSPAAQWVEDGLGVAAAESWWAQPLDEWISNLAGANVLPAVSDIFAPAAAGEFSEHVLLPARGLFFRESVGGGEPSRVRALWKGAGGDPEHNAALYQRAVRAARASSGQPVQETRPGKRGAARAGAKGAASSGAEEGAATAPPDAAAPGGRKTAPGSRARPERPPAPSEPGTAPEPEHETAPKANRETAPKATKRATAQEAEPATAPATGESGAQEPGPKGELVRRAEERARRARTTQYRHGLGLVEVERARYGSRAGDEALAAALALEPGPDAVSLTVFATTEDPLAPVCPSRPQAVFGSASDLALAGTVAAARASELAVLLSLEVLARPTGAWADVLSWTGGEEQGIFWARYERITQHYALLAQLLGLELFSFGSNLGSNPDENAPQLMAAETWHALCGRMHTLYDGALVFTAPSPEAAEQLSFLAELDVIGLTLFPRGLSDEPDEDELRRMLRFELQQALDLGVRWDKPLLLVQVGFPARADSWPRPAVPRGENDPGAQQRYFEALADVLEQELDNVATLRGFFLWNWPLAGEHASAGGFSLRETTVAAALRRLFAR